MTQSVDPACRHFLPADYTCRLAPDYFDDTETELVWQPDVYDDAAEVARRLQARRIIDVGCGGARKLTALHPDFELIGIDFGANTSQCREKYSFGTWIEHDLDSSEPLPLTREQLDGAVIISSDVIEHLVHPERLLARLREALPLARALVLSTPERVLTWGPEHRGPPQNPCHIREWSMHEFELLLRWSGFQHVSVGLTRSSDKDPLLRTIFALACPTGAHLRRASFVRRP